MAILVADIEVFSNYFLLYAMDVKTGNAAYFETYPGKRFPIEEVKGVLDRNTIVTFNGNGFDMPLLNKALKGADCAKLKSLCDELILGDKKPWQLNLDPPVCDHIDLIEVAPGRASLKLYGGRMHAPTLQDLPFDPNQAISEEQREVVIRYCANDLVLTSKLYLQLLPQITLREHMTEQYGVDLRSKSDAQIAETVIFNTVNQCKGGTLERKQQVTPGKTFRYDVPTFIRPAPEVTFASECVFTISDSGSPQCKALENHIVTIGNTKYRMGIGGLHSLEKSVFHVSGADTLLIDRDVSSYYPSIIRECHLSPEHMGNDFLGIYSGFIDERLAAKHAGNKTVADTFKILLNGTFGKLGSRYSAMYAPKLLIQVTLTGQLALLMLIRAIEKAGIHVVSANTDGIVIKCPRNRLNELNNIIWYWECLTGFETEETRYSALYSRDVNNYIAVKTDGNVKTKGTFAKSGLSKNPQMEIVNAAVIAYLTNGTPVEDTIRECDDITKFVTVRTVNGGARTVDGTPLGKVVRWYYGTTNSGTLHYIKNGNKVPASDDAVPCQVIPGCLPPNIYYAAYIAMAEKNLSTLGVTIEATHDRTA